MSKKLSLSVVGVAVVLVGVAVLAMVLWRSRNDTPATVDTVTEQPASPETMRGTAPTSDAPIPPVPHN